MTTHTPDDRTPTEHWDDRYREQDALWQFRPNAVLAAEAPRIRPGTALDLGAGEGGDALFLAELGWTVTAVDLSQVALDRGAAHAVERGLTDRITWRQADLGEWDPTTDERYDLVTSHFFHSFVALDSEEILRTATRAVAVGGRLLVVRHTGAPHWPVPDTDAEGTDADAEGTVADADGTHQHGGHASAGHEVLPGPDGVLAGLRLDPDAWQVELCELRPRAARLPDGSTVTIDDAVVLVSRLR